MSRTNEEIGATIRTLIEEAGYNNSQFASIANVSPSLVSKWKAGSHLTLDALFLLSKHLNCSIDYILTGEEFSQGNTPPRTHVDRRVEKYFEILKGQESNGISLTDAMNFLIASDMVDDDNPEMPNPDARLAWAWATFLSIDTIGITPKNRRTASIHIEDIKLKHEIDVTSLETLELCQIMDLLREKKKQYIKRKNYLQLHKENQTREEIVTDELITKIQTGKTVNNLSYRNGGKL